MVSNVWAALQPTEIKEDLLLGYPVVSNHFCLPNMNDAKNDKTFLIFQGGVLIHACSSLLGLVCAKEFVFLLTSDFSCERNFDS